MFRARPVPKAVLKPKLVKPKPAPICLPITPFTLKRSEAKREDIAKVSNLTKFCDLFSLLFPLYMSFITFQFPNRITSYWRNINFMQNRCQNLCTKNRYRVSVKRTTSLVTRLSEFDKFARYTINFLQK